MPTNDRSQITEDEINRLKKFRGKVKDFLNGVERWLPEDNPHKTPEQLAALREMEKYPRKDSLYTPEELTAILKEDKFRCWHKTQILFSKKNFKSIKRIIEPRWPTEWSIFKETWDEIDAIIERGSETNSFERDTSGRFRPGFAASHPFLNLIESLDYIIGKLTEQNANDSGGYTRVSNNGEDKAVSFPTCTLSEFIEQNCQLPIGASIKSKVTLIFRRAGKNEKRIDLPPLAKEHKTGQAKIFYEADLRRNWPTYCKEIPTLYMLKTPPTDK